MTCAGSFTQAGAAKALSEGSTEAMKPVWQDWERRCEYATSSLDRISGLSAAMPEGAFYAWTDISETGLRSEEFAARLLQEHHVAVVPGAAFGDESDGYVRVTCVRSWDELVTGIERMGSFVQSL